ncbi:hypothetical protein ACSZOK_12650 [Aeromonas veronii]|uniref:hypothetical protein n=1 Tax=Aeromonas veronii TaxID=654 RepID=UPI003EC86A5E
MKRTLLSVMVLLGVSAGAHAENLLDIYQQAQIKDPQLLQSKAVRDQAFEKINESRALCCPRSIWVPGSIICKARTIPRAIPTPRVK